jgi:hypothetical protein
MSWFNGREGRLRTNLDIIVKDDSMSRVEYTKRNGLLDKPSWKRFFILQRATRK